MRDAKKKDKKRTTHNAPRTTHDAQRTTHNAPRNIEVRLEKGFRGISVLWIKKVVATTLTVENVRRRSVSVLLTGDKEIRKINKQYLNHDYATDVISFEFKDESDYLGDIVVSVDTAASFAKELGIPLKEEVARYLVHGTLHLLGYDDKKKTDRRNMFKRQEEILKKVMS